MNKLILSLAALLLGGLTASAIADVDAEGKLVYRDGVIRSAVPAVVYTAAGVKVAEDTEIAADALAGGVYIVRAGAEILKIVR